LWLRVVLVVVAVAQRRLGPELVGHDLHDRAGAAVLSRPGPLLEPADHYDPLPLDPGDGGCRGML
jgi:hypothetical protein